MQKVLPSLAASGSGRSGVVTLPGVEGGATPSIEQVAVIILLDGYFIGFGCLIASPFTFASRCAGGSW